MIEYSIMPKDRRYSTIRYDGLERNEIFGGANRQRSIKYGLVVFLTPELHRTGKHSFHKAPLEWIWLKKLAEETWCECYNKTKEDFLEEFGKNYD